MSNRQFGTFGKKAVKENARFVEKTTDARKGNVI